MKILYAEDEKSLSMAIVEILKMEGYEVEAVYDGIQTIDALKTGAYDAVILDIMMPKADGIAVLRQMRENEDYTPVILLTAKAEVEDRIVGLSAGADDYLGKPFSAGELLARLSAILRRDTSYQNPVHIVGNITLDCATGELHSDVSSLRLCHKETQLLSLFMKHKSTRFSANELQKKLWKKANDTQIVALYISYLQDKLVQLQASVVIRQYGDCYQLEDVESI